jgi:hypothetical protein
MTTIVIIQSWVSARLRTGHVLEDLVSQPEISDADYQIVHYDGPDRRGVDVALLYDPKKFEFESSESIPFTFDSTEIAFSMTKEQQANFRTRDVLMVRGRINGEEFAIFVAHLPSRIGGKGGDLRDRGAEIIYNRAMKLEQEVPGIKIVAMGDMNDNPTDDSIAKYLHGKETMDEVGPQDFYSPFLSMLKAGYGSLAYRGEWNIYDIIVVNASLAKGKGMNISENQRQRFLWKSLQTAIYDSAGRPIQRNSVPHILQWDFHQRI